MGHTNIFSMFRVVHDDRGISFEEYNVEKFLEKKQIQMKNKSYFLVTLKIECLYLSFSKIPNFSGFDLKLTSISNFST